MVEADNGGLADAIIHIPGGKTRKDVGMAGMKPGRNTVQAFAEYRRMLEHGEEPTPKSALFDFVKRVSSMGGGDFSAGMKLLQKQTALSPLELSVIENIIMPEKEISAVTAAMFDNLPETVFRDLLPAIVLAKSRINPPTPPIQEVVVNAFDDVHLSKIAENSRLGYSIKEIAKDASVSASTVKRIRKRLGIRKNKKKTLT